MPQQGVKTFLPPLDIRSVSPEALLHVHHQIICLLFCKVIFLRHQAEVEGKMHIMHFLEPLKSLVVLAVVVGLVAEWGLNQFLAAKAAK